VVLVVGVVVVVRYADLDGGEAGGEEGEEEGGGGGFHLWGLVRVWRSFFWKWKGCGRDVWLLSRRSGVLLWWVILVRFEGSCSPL
jgi:hypothetical protein